MDPVLPVPAPITRVLPKSLVWLRSAAGRPAPLPLKPRPPRPLPALRSPLFLPRPLLAIPLADFRTLPGPTVAGQRSPTSLLRGSSDWNPEFL